MVGTRSFHSDSMYLPDTYFDVVAEAIFMCETGHHIRILGFLRCQGQPQPVYKGTVIGQCHLDYIVYEESARLLHVFGHGS